MPQIYVITGASRGIDLEYVRQLSNQEDNIIYASARNPEGSKELMELADNKKATPFTIGIDSFESIENAAANVSETATEGIDTLINNAGIGSKFEETILNIPKEEYIRLFATNVGSVINVTQVFLLLLRKRGNDKVKKIINLGSIMSSLDMSIKADTTTAMSPYKVSKGALNTVTG